jgi:hypothetical protein
LSVPNTIPPCGLVVTGNRKAFGRAMGKHSDE